MDLKPKNCNRRQRRTSYNKEFNLSRRHNNQTHMNSIWTSKYIQEILKDIKRKAESKIIAGNVNTLLSTVNKAFRQEINK